MSSPSNIDKPRPSHSLQSKPESNQKKGKAIELITDKSLLVMLLLGMTSNDSQRLEFFKSSH